jgi:putative PIN family toxin of toxin-antitoxin system
VIAVLDTNVLVSGIINPHGPPGRIVDLLRAGELRLAVDDRILSEYAEVLRRPRLASYFAGQDVEHILDYLRYNSERLIATTHISGLPDEHDAPFLELAKAAGAILVKGNQKHFPILKRSGVKVESPAEFVRRYES